MSHVRVHRESRTVSVTVGTSSATSTSLRASGFAGGVVDVSGVTASATMTLFGSADGGVTFAPVHGVDGAALTVTVPADGGMVSLPDAPHGLTFMRLVSGTDLGTTTTVSVTMKS